jgi:hypothetical protein
MSPGAQMTGGPQRMKANWKVVETKCLTCYGPFTFGEEVCLCIQCGGYHHAGCWDSSGGCTHPGGFAAARGATVIEGATAFPAPMPPPPAPVAYGAPPPPAYGTPPPPAYGAPPPGYGAPPPMQPQPLASDEQYCPRCGNIVKTNALSCRFCNTSLSYGSVPTFGRQPYGGIPFGGAVYGGMTPDLNGRASGARNCGLIALICWGIQLLIGVLIGVNSGGSASDAAESLKAFIVPILLLGLTAIVLGIVAIAKGNGVKRILDQFPHDPSIRSKATAGVVMGWISTAVFALGVIMNIVRSAR